MSEENVEIVRQMFELFRRRDAGAEDGFGEADVEGWYSWVTRV